jgi:hypothetical protein
VEFLNGNNFTIFEGNVGCPEGIGFVNFYKSFLSMLDLRTETAK